MSTHTSSLTSIAFAILVSCHLIRVCTSGIILIKFEEERDYLGTFCKPDNSNRDILQKMCDKLVRLAGIENKTDMFHGVSCMKETIHLCADEIRARIIMAPLRNYDLLVCEVSNGFRKALGRGENPGDVVEYAEKERSPADSGWWPEEKIEDFSTEFLPVSEVITFEAESKYEGTFCQPDNSNTDILRKMCEKLVRLAGIEIQADKFQNITCTKGALSLRNKVDDIVTTSPSDLLVCECDDSSGFRKALGRGKKPGDVVKYDQSEGSPVDSEWRPEEILEGFSIEFLPVSEVVTYEEEKKYKGTFCKPDNSNTSFLQKMCVKLVRLAGIEIQPDMFQNITCTEGQLVLRAKDVKDVRARHAITSPRDLLVCECDDSADSGGFRKALGRGKKPGDVVKYKQDPNVVNFWLPEEYLEGFSKDL